MNLNPRQRQFVLEYLIDFNATRAAIRAGYLARNADVTGPRLLGNVGIQAALKEAIEERSRRTEITADRVLKELALIAYADQQDYFIVNEDGSVRVKQFSEMPEGATRAISGIEEIQRIMGSGEGGKDMILEQRRKLRHHDKVRALELLGNHLGMWKDKTELTFGDSETFEMPKLAVPAGNGKGKNDGNNP